MLLFYGVLACAEESLTISYPALDDKAQALPPSPYVTEIRRTLGPKHNRSSVLAIRNSRPLGPATRSARLIGEFKPWRRALDGKIEPLAGLFRCERGDSPQMSGEKRKELGERGTVPVSAIDAGLRIVHHRACRETFGPAEGLLISPAAAARFADRFGQRHLWSPSQWETYAACPYKFFLENVLRLEPLGDLQLETDYRRRGSRLHDVLAEFHRQWKAARGERTLAPNRKPSNLPTICGTLSQSACVTSRTGVEAALVELDRRQILKWAERHFDHHARYEAIWSKLDARLEPAHFELRFGPPRSGEGDADDPNSCDDAFTLTIHGEPVRVTGRIDRIDVARIGERRCLQRDRLQVRKKSQLEGRTHQFGRALAVADLRCRRASAAVRRRRPAAGRGILDNG